MEEAGCTLELEQLELGIHSGLNYYILFILLKYALCNLLFTIHVSQGTLKWISNMLHGLESVVRIISQLWAYFLVFWWFPLTSSIIVFESSQFSIWYFFIFHCVVKMYNQVQIL